MKYVGSLLALALIIGYFIHISTSKWCLIADVLLWRWIYSAEYLSPGDKMIIMLMAILKVSKVEKVNQAENPLISVFCSFSARQIQRFAAGGIETFDVFTQNYGEAVDRNYWIDPWYKVSQTKWSSSRLLQQSYWTIFLGTPCICIICTITPAIIIIFKL